jgi:hypothetical protein
MKRNLLHPTVALGHIHALALLSLLFHVVSVSAESPEQLYSRGKAAFERGNYLSAAKYLFAFTQTAPADVVRDVAKEVESAITYSDQQIDLALRTKKQLDQYGRVTQVVSSGKADDPNSKPVRHNVSLPNSTPGQKPTLPAQPPRRAVRLTPADLPLVRGDLLTQPPPIVTRTPQAVAEADAQLKIENQELRLKIETARKEIQRLREKLESTQLPEKTAPK